MAQATPTRSQMQFGPFTVDLRTGELLKCGTRIKLQARPFCILAMLLENPGKVVTREEIRAHLWPDGTFVDFDNNISSAIGKLRAALGDAAAAPRYIETAGRGYRLAVIVKPVDAEHEAIEAAKPSAEYESAASPSVPKTLRARWILVAAIVCLVSVGVLIYSSHRPRPQHSSQSAPARMMLAVLPFENLTGDPGQDYFSDGFTEEMITQLGNLDPKQLGVIARTSIEHYKRSYVPLVQVSRELGVDYVLEGSVRRSGEQVRITAQLIHTGDQTHVWAREYDRDMKNLLQVQTEIAHEIADEIQLTFHEPGLSRAGVAARFPADQETYDLYLRGLYSWNKRTVDGLRQAIQFFEKAIAKNTSYAPAYAGLANCYALLGGYGVAPQDDFMVKAESAALRALQLDDRLAPAHAALALISESHDWDWQTAEKEFRRAIELDPNYATAHEWYAEHLGWRGRFDEAFSEIGRARQLDPLSLVVATDEASILYYSRQYDRSIARFQAVLDMQPHFPAAHAVAFAYLQQHMLSSAAADLEKWDRPEDGVWNLMIRAYLSQHSGRPAQAREALKQLLDTNRRHPIDPAPIIFTYISLGEYNEAFSWFEKACQEHSTALRTLKVEPFYDPLRADPRFQALLNRVGLAN